MLSQIEQDRMRAAHMEMLYHASGRTNGIYTGLWDEYKKQAAELARLYWWEEECARLKDAEASSK